MTIDQPLLTQPFVNRIAADPYYRVGLAGGPYKKWIGYSPG